MADDLPIDPEASLQFVINAGAGSSDADAQHDLIRSVLRAEGRQGEVHVCKPDELPDRARSLAHTALARRTALIAVGGDGTLNTVAQAAHTAGCPIGVVPQGTFNYFARTHGIPTDPTDAVRLLLQSTPMPVQIAAVNDHVFLVNASLGLYPELLEDREAYKARFGRSRWVAFMAACASLWRAQRRLRLRIEGSGSVRDLQALTLFVGNNRLQLQQFGVEPDDSLPGTPGDGTMAAVVLRPAGAMAMFGLVWHAAMGTLGEAPGVERFEFRHLVVRPRLALGRRSIKVAFDGEVTSMRAPLEFRVLARPLYLMMPRRPDGVIAKRSGIETAVG
ncbi:MAG TPA: diacylglycerol kinase family protein [Burkholderiaceae bacterium]|nr:diacylglycerol kinase family protein [Burkholderiaceae bacterium]